MGYRARGEIRYGHWNVTYGALVWILEKGHRLITSSVLYGGKDVQDIVQP